MQEKDAEGKSRPGEREARNGFLTGIALLVLSGYFFVTGWFVPRPEGWLTAPAMLPLFLGGTLFIMAAVITLDTIKQGAFRALFDVGPGDATDGRPLWRIVFAVAAVAIFYFGLLRFLYFEIATAIFLFAMMQVYWREGSFGARLAIAVILPFLISGAFQGGFGIPLPGDSNIVQELLYWLRHRGA
jgi:hypothetical protein